MNGDMFCFQCEQTAGGKGCTKTGVCGKEASTANLQDDLTSKMIELADACKPSDELVGMLEDGLFTTITNVNFDDKSIKTLINKISAKIPKGNSFDIKSVWECDEDLRSLKSLILFGLRGVAAYAHHARVLSYKDKEIDDFFFEALRAVSRNLSADKLLKTVLKVGEINLKCMELLDRANTETYGNPVPTEVSTCIEKGPFIIVSGHDLRDLELLLKQTQGKGINIYTHGEMLPCHAYPRLKQYKHLKGNFGTAWQNQQKEFNGVPAPILFTTNCIMPVRDSYKDRVFTTSVVQYPEIKHIGDDKDFSPVIKKSLELGGYAKDTEMTGINGGKILKTGFGRNAVLSAADKIVAGVKSGKIRKFFLVGGLRRGKTRTQLLYRICKIHTVRYDNIDARLRKISFQRFKSRRHRRHTSIVGYGTMQRRIFRYKCRYGACGYFQMRRQRSSAFDGAFLVRAKGGLHTVDTALSRNKRHKTWPDSSRVCFCERIENTCR